MIVQSTDSAHYESRRSDVPRASAYPTLRRRPSRTPRATLVFALHVRHQRPDVRERQTAPRAHLPPRARPPRRRRSATAPSPLMRRLRVRDERREVRKRSATLIAHFTREGHRGRSATIRIASDDRGGGADARHPRAVKRRAATRRDPRGGRRPTRRGDPSAAQFRSIAAEMFIREPMFQAHLCATRLALVRVHGGEFLLTARDGASRDSRGMTRRVARLSSVPVERDVDALSGDVFHAAAAQRTHHARGILRQRKRRREGSVRWG